MKNKHFTFINTGDTYKEIEYVVKLPDGQTVTETFRLAPKEIADDTVYNLYLRQGKEVQSVTVFDPKTNTRTPISGSAFGNAAEILKNSVLLDIETTGRLGRDSITQIAVHDYQSAKTTMFVPTPNALLGVEPKLGEAAYKSRGSVLDSNLGDATFREIKYSDTLRQMALRNPTVYGSYAGGNTDKLVEAIRKDPALKSAIEDEMIRTDKFQAVQMVEDEAKLIKAKVGVDSSGLSLIHI